MSMTHGKRIKLKSLVENVPPGMMVTTAWLRGQLDLDPRSIHEYVEHGWLLRVMHGLYQRPYSRGFSVPAGAQWQIPVLSAQLILEEGVHPGGQTALEMAGYAHYLPIGDSGRVHLYGEIPAWFKRLPQNESFEFHTSFPFAENRLGVVEHSVGGRDETWNLPMRISSPERAILEMLDELPHRTDFDVVDRIFEGLTTLRPQLLTLLLEACRSIQIRRLFFVFADRHAHAWRKYLDLASFDLGSGPRSLVSGWKIHPVHKISVPAEYLSDSSGEERDA